MASMPAPKAYAMVLLFMAYHLAFPCQRWFFSDSGFPKCSSFTLCMSVEVTETKDQEDIKTSFYDETGIPVTEWDKTFIDQELKKHPDIVTDLFGDDVDEHLQGMCQFKTQNLKSSIR